MILKRADRVIYDLIKSEEKRQRNCIELIASENFTSEAVQEAVGSCLTNKYTEGYPGDRYYGGCDNYDAIEEVCKSRYLILFNCYKGYMVNVQPHSGSTANFAAYKAIGLKPGDTVLAMELDDGGHLTHGSKANFSGQLYNIIPYGVGSDGYIDYSEVLLLAKKYNPKAIMCGASSYSRIIDFEKFAFIAEDVGAKLIADISHIAGLVATGYHMSPFGFADIVTTTTHKTLRGPRGAIIFGRTELENQVNSSVFPYAQGGALQHVIAGKAVAAAEAYTTDFIKYIGDVVKNTALMCEQLKSQGFEIVTGGTDNHMFVIDFTRTHPNLTGRQAQNILERNGITVNKQCVPNEKRSVKDTSGIRIGLAAMTTKGWREDDVTNCSIVIKDILEQYVE